MPDQASTEVDRYLSLLSRQGMPALPWQQRFLSHVGAKDPGGWLRPEVGLVVSRQNGKSQALAAVMLVRAARGERVLYATGSNRAAADLLRRMEDWVTTDPVLLAAVPRVYHSQGREVIRFARGEITVITALGRPPRGFDKVGLLVIDEARELRDWTAIGALSPTQAVLGRRAQRIIVSNAGDDYSLVLNAARDAGRAAALAGDTDRAWLEYSAAPDCAIDDPAALVAANPAVEDGLLSLDWLRTQAVMLPEATFRTEHLCQWVSALDTLVDLSLFDALEDPNDALPGYGGLAFGFDSALDRSDSAIGAAWRDSLGTAHWQLVDHRAGSEWVVPRLVELVGRWDPVCVAYDNAGPALDLAANLRRQLPRARMVGLGAREYAAASAAALSLITDGRLRHAHSRPVRDALAVAGSRPLSDAWAWSRRGSQASIAALVAVTVAQAGFDENIRPGKPKVIAATRE